MLWIFWADGYLSVTEIIGSITSLGLVWNYEIAMIWDNPPNSKDENISNSLSQPKKTHFGVLGTGITQSTPCLKNILFFLFGTTNSPTPKKTPLICAAWVVVWLTAKWHQGKEITVMLYSKAMSEHHPIMIKLGMVYPISLLTLL